MALLWIFVKICLLLGYLPLCVLSFWWSTAGEISPEVSDICMRSARFRSPMKEMCNYGGIIEEIMRGVRVALEECKDNMRDQRWDCSNQDSALVRLLKHDTRESAYLRAMVSVGSMYSVLDGCSRGSVDHCDCRSTRGRLKQKPLNHTSPSFRFLDPTRNSEVLTNHRQHASWAWRGCDSSIKFAYKISKNFIDEPEKRAARDFKGDVHLHNYEAGRLAGLLHMRKQCRCHGMSGSCVMQTCWLNLPYFSDVAQRLKLAYKKAVMVTSTNRHYGKGDRSLVPIRKKSKLNDLNKFKGHEQSADFFPKQVRKRRKRKNPKIVKRQALVYSQESPNYCVHNERFGSHGTEGRQCELKGNRTGGCDFLCCGRGFKTEERIVEISCECKFEWCCDILCKQCTDVVVEHRCR